MRKVTLKDVASAAGVSPSVVSAALNNRSYTRISIQRRERIQAVASRLGYRPNFEASCLSLGRSASIGIFLPGWLDVLLQELVQGLSAAAFTYSLPLSFSFGLKPSSYSFFVKSMHSYRHSGIISYVPNLTKTSAEISDSLNEYMRDGGKVISLNPANEPLKGSSVFRIDESYGGKLAAEYLLQKKEIESFAAVCVPGSRFAARLDSFCSIIGGENKKVEVYNLLGGKGINAESIRKAFDDLFEKLPKPIAFFLTCTGFSNWLFNLATEKRLKYEKDYFVVAYDRQDFFGDLHPIPRIIQPFYQMGYAAIEKLNTLLLNKEGLDEVLKPKLVVGGSLSEWKNSQ